MMKKIMAFLLALMMLLSMSAMAEETIELPRVTESNSTLYQNTYLGYSLRVWEYLVQMPDEVNQAMLEQLKEVQDEDDDDLYDVRYWVIGVTDGTYLTFCIQLKERTNATFEEEIAMSAQYAAIMNERLEKEGEAGHYENIHDGILRDTPAGQMLETAYTYTDAEGKTTTIVYYDFYYNTIEYCFELECDSDLISFEALQQMLMDMMSTVAVESVISEA